MSETDEWTIGRLLEWTTRFLKERGAENARLDAEVLLAEARGSRRIDLYTSFTDIPADDVRTRFRDLVRRRAEGMPVAYLVGRREFYSHSFRVTTDVLIPRPETELLLIRLLDLMGEMATREQPIEVCDVGTGSGVLAICAAKRFANARVTAIDVSAAALAIARANANEHAVAERIEFVEGDLFSNFPSDRSFDFIVSNPPYVSTSEMASLPRDIRDYEPRLALEAGARGTEVIERLLPQSAERLRAKGWLLVEVSPMIEPTVRKLFAAEERFEAATTIKDLASLPRIVQARRR